MARLEVKRCTQPPPSASCVSLPSEAWEIAKEQPEEPDPSELWKPTHYADLQGAPGPTQWCPSSTSVCEDKRSTFLRAFGSNELLVGRCSASAWAWKPLEHTAHLWSAAPSDPVHHDILTPSPCEALISHPEDGDVPRPLEGGSVLLGHLLHGDVAPSSS